MDGSQVTVIIPAFNEAADVADTIRSIQAQTLEVQTIRVIDDGSDDGTGEIARSAGATVVRPAARTGSKAGALSFALDFVDTPYVVAVDADTTLARDALERIFAAFDDARVAAACGFVMPRHRRTLWERGRYVECLVGFSIGRSVQDYYGTPIVASGCFSAYRTDVLREVGGWQARTLTEDLDLTWTLYRAGYRVRFVRDAGCFPIDPHTLNLMSLQLRRWTHGMVQNLRLHWRGLIAQPFLFGFGLLAVVDTLVASLLSLLVLPALLLWTRDPMYLLPYVLDCVVLPIPVVYGASKRRQVAEALLSIPSLYVLRLLNFCFVLEAWWSEVVLGRRLAVFHKGH